MDITIYDNKKFGNFTVLKTINSEKCLCQCICGKIKEVWTCHLKTGKSTSCGCSKRNKGSSTWKGYEEIPLTFFNKVRRKAIERNRNYSFDLKIEEVWNLFLRQNKKCALTGLPINFPETHNDMKNNLNISVDRIDNSKGYTLNNIWLIKPHVNLMKNRLSMSTFINFCKLVENPLQNDYADICLENKISGLKFAWIKRGATSRGIEFNLKKEECLDLYKRQKGKCAITGLFISLNVSGLFDECPVASLDRIDSQKGYNINNVMYVHKTINLMKNILPLSDFKTYCGLIYNKYLKGDFYEITFA